MTATALPDDFDPEVYLKLHADVAAAGVDATRHYLEHGRREGRPYQPMSRRLLPAMGDEAFDFDGLKSVHNHDFMGDTAFLSAYARGVQAVGGDYQWFWRVHIGLWAAATAARLPGDFVECGVNRGFLSSAIMHHLDWDTTGKTFYLLDTFEGIDPRYLNANEIEAGIADRNRSDIASGFYTLDLAEVRANFSEWKNQQIVVGSIPETLVSITSSQLAFVHIDLNCTEPEVAAIDFLWSRLVTGAIVLLDDYAYRGYQPQKEGMDHWAQTRGVAIASLPSGQGLIIKN